MATVDKLLRGRVKIMQREKGLKATGDAILLASAVDRKILKRGARVLDAGVGGGAVALMLLERFADISAVGVDIQDEMLDLARASADLNGAAARLTLMKEDIARPGAAFKRMEFDAVVTNPPYNGGRASPEKSKARGHAENGLGLGRWIEACVRRLRSSGAFAIVHRAARADDVVLALKRNGMGRIEIFPFYSKKGEAASRVVVRAIKGSRAGAVIHPGVVLHESGGSFSALAERLFEDGDTILTILDEFV
jgi:tRNA1(Val) A37 N6-methylase TrmN6